jgi:hypothetical protein
VVRGYGGSPFTACPPFAARSRTAEVSGAAATPSATASAA